MKYSALQVERYVASVQKAVSGGVRTSPFGQLRAVDVYDITSNEQSIGRGAFLMYDGPVQIEMNFYNNGSAKVRLVGTDATAMRKASATIDDLMQGSNAAPVIIPSSLPSGF